MALGLSDVSAESCNYLLEKGKKNGGGTAIAIVVGGAKEGKRAILLDARPCPHSLGVLSVVAQRWTRGLARCVAFCA
jgi:hypothetical protein